MKHAAALILAAGKGSRMHSDIPKQFLEVNGKPLFLYSVEKFLTFCDPVIVVTSADALSYVREMIASDGLSGRVQVCAGGRERYESSLNGLRFLAECGDAEYVLIHDAARAAVPGEVIGRVLADTEKYGASIAAVPVIDTVKAADENGFVKDTPDRRTLFSVQTPQGFRTELIREAFGKMMRVRTEHPENMPVITDDASVVECFTDVKVKITEGDYRNIKLTTPEDLPRISGALK